MEFENIAQLFDLTNKGAIVTGGAMGIGEAIVERLAQAGASVMIADVNTDAARQTAGRINASGGKVHFMKADAGSVADAERVVQSTVEAFGRLDVLVNSAGIYPFSKALEISKEMWDKVYKINTKGVFFYSKAAAQKMINCGNGGRIVNIASTGALGPTPTGGLAHYDSSKSAVVMITKALALELGPHGILVNAVAPGSTLTPGTGERLKGERGKFLSSKLPLGRMGEPDDIAKVVLFLVSAAADYVTGTVVVVDGGYLLM
ncbi:MAG: SDR family oxidoreductase [Chloroflexi bacterium]|nr:SDR family oxidoreductase [Chloroflexota bacterium]